MSELNGRIVRIEKSVLSGTRPRSIGYNARIPTHGPNIGDTPVRVHTDGGAFGVGWSHIAEEQAEAIVGKSVSDLFELPSGSTNEDGNAIDLPLWDLAAKLNNQPLYQLLGAQGSREVELYDGSIYIDDLEASDEEVRDIFFEEVRSGQEHGYLNFKIKIGRGSRWMPQNEGLARDILVIHTVREAAGPDSKILIDANMGNTLNTAKTILRECADVGIYWFEEPFAEDTPLNEDLKKFIIENGYNTLIADGEFAPPSSFFRIVERGWIDVVQHDFRFMGLTWWVETAERIRPWGALCGPHTWGSFIERFHHAHFGASIPHYSLLEAAPADLPGIITDDWELRDGKLIVPDVPGCGFDIEKDVFEQGVNTKNGFTVSI